MQFPTFIKSYFNFNPLPRKEGDNKKQARLFLVKISIHSLVKRETPPLNLSVSMYIFQSTPS